MTYTGSIGTAYIMCRVDGQPREFIFTNAVYSPDNGVNLVSETQLMDLGANLKTLREAKDLTLGQKQFIASRWGGLYTIDLWESTPDFAIAAFNVPFETLTWHGRIGHLGARNLLKLADVSTGMDLKRKRGNNDKSDNKNVYCSHYAVSRLTARPH